MLTDWSTEQNKIWGSWALSPYSSPTQRTSAALGAGPRGSWHQKGARVPSVVADLGSAVWDTVTLLLPSPTALLAVRTLELLSPRRLCTTGTGTSVFLSLPQWKSVRALPIISPSNTENSHNCHSPYFSKCKNKVKNVLLFQCICSQNIQWLEQAMSFGSGCWTTLQFCLLRSRRPWEFLVLSFLFSQLCPHTCSKSNWKGLTGSWFLIFSSQARMFRI